MRHIFDWFEEHLCSRFGRGQEAKCKKCSTFRRYWFCLKGLDQRDFQKISIDKQILDHKNENETRFSEQGGGAEKWHNWLYWMRCKISIISTGWGENRWWEENRVKKTVILSKYFQNDVVQNDVSALCQKYHELIATSWNSNAVLRHV